MGKKLPDPQPPFLHVTGEKRRAATTIILSEETLVQEKLEEDSSVCYIHHLVKSLYPFKGGKGHFLGRPRRRGGVPSPPSGHQEAVKKNSFKSVKMKINDRKGVACSSFPKDICTGKSPSGDSGIPLDGRHRPWPFPSSTREREAPSSPAFLEARKGGASLSESVSHFGGEGEAGDSLMPRNPFLPTASGRR